MLVITMLSMGFTLSVDDLTSVLASPYRVGIGAALQYTIMPSLGFLLAKLQGLPPPFAAGIIIVACCPGGIASNIISYLARADVGLSVMMTTVRCCLRSTVNKSCAYL
jgi:BASS family bile acid:Na+ symporter